MAGTDSGTTIVRKMPTSPAPSIRAASIRSRGSVMKKLRSRKIPNGSANAVWASQIAPIAVGQPERLEQRQQRDERDLDRHQQQRDDDQEESSRGTGSAATRTHTPPSTPGSAGRSVDGMAMIMLLMNAWPMPWALRTCS